MLKIQKIFKNYSYFSKKYSFINIQKIIYFFKLYIINIQKKYLFHISNKSPKNEQILTNIFGIIYNFVKILGTTSLIIILTDG